jgi:hypothetical protein
MKKSLNTYVLSSIVQIFKAFSCSTPVPGKLIMNKEGNQEGKWLNRIERKYTTQVVHQIGTLYAPVAISRH